MAGLEDNKVIGLEETKKRGRKPGQAQQRGERISAALSTMTQAPSHFKSEGSKIIRLPCSIRRGCVRSKASRAACKSYRTLTRAMKGCRLNVARATKRTDVCLSCRQWGTKVEPLHTDIVGEINDSATKIDGRYLRSMERQSQSNCGMARANIHTFCKVWLTLTR